jgi:hypothetical protein
MYDKVSRLAEHVATSLSRRAFLARLGVVPLALATFVGERAAGARPTCIYQGSCCGGVYPYYSTKDRLCHADRQCQNAGAQCSPSPRCCGGTGWCLSGTCYSDQNCLIAC